MKSVVLPAPFGPIRPQICPALTSNETLSRAMIAAKRTDNPLMLSSGALLSPAVRGRSAASDVSVCRHAISCRATRPNSSCKAAQKPRKPFTIASCRIDNYNAISSRKFQNIPARFALFCALSKASRNRLRRHRLEKDILLVTLPTCYLFRNREGVDHIDIRQTSVDR